MVERLSLSDNSLFSSYAEDIQWHEFALAHVRGKRVLDAGCGTGFGSHFLATHGAKSVLAMDISEDAIAEAKFHYSLPNLSFERRDIETLCSDPPAGPIDVVTSFGNLPHLNRPEAFVAGAAAILSSAGTFIVTSPNGQVYPVDAVGKPLYKYQFRTFTAETMTMLVSPHFPRLTVHGQWLTHAGQLRKIRAKELFDQLCEAYYNPMMRMGRMIKRLTGGTVLPAPIFSGTADSVDGDYVVLPLDSKPFPWPASTIIIVADR